MKCDKCGATICCDKHRIEKVNGKPAVQCDNCGCFNFLPGEEKEEMSREEILKIWRKQNKYKNTKPIMDGIKFDSKREAYRYKELKFLEEQGELFGLQLQVPFIITINKKRICTYIADFTYSYKDKPLIRIVEDAKGYRTSIYKLKKKLVEAMWNIKILET